MDSLQVFFSAVRELPLAKTLFLRWLSGSVLFNGDILNTKVLSLRCDFAAASIDMAAGQHIISDACTEAKCIGPSLDRIVCRPINGRVCVHLLMAE